MRNIFTHHARDRFTERWYSRYPKSTETLESIFARTKEDRSLFNDHRRMIDIYEKYGFDLRYRFRVFDEFVFIGVEDFDRSHNEPCCVIVTVLQVSSGRSYSRLLSPPRFNHLEKHREVYA